MPLFKQLWDLGVRRVRDEYEETQDDIEHSSPLFRFVLISFIAYLVLAVFVGIYWSFYPESINPRTAVQTFLADQDISSPPELPAGVTTTATLIAVTETLWKKPGGYLSNDMLPPGLWLDDMSHWELGVVLQTRDVTQMLRASFSQSSMSIQVDNDLQKAETRFNFSNRSWIFPATESQYRSGVEHLKKYAFRLIQNNAEDAHFYNDAQHLNDYLAGVEQRLKNLSQRLTASVGPSVNTDAAAMSVAQRDSKGLANGLYTKTPWMQLDDVFYEARGSSWALIALLQGIKIDFNDALKNKNALASYEQIIRELKATQQPVYSPMILNGDGFGFLANHSLVMASYLSRAQAAVADCRHLLLAPTP